MKKSLVETLRVLEKLVLGRRCRPLARETQPVAPSKPLHLVKLAGVSELIIYERALHVPSKHNEEKILLETEWIQAQDLTYFPLPSEPFINPDPLTYRLLFCPDYDSCLTIAALRNWPNFICTKCKRFINRELFNNRTTLSNDKGDSK